MDACTELIKYIIKINFIHFFLLLLMWLLENLKLYMWLIKQDWSQDTCIKSHYMNTNPFKYLPKAVSVLCSEGTEKLCLSGINLVKGPHIWAWHDMLTSWSVSRSSTGHLMLMFKSRCQGWKVCPYNWIRHYGWNLLRNHEVNPSAD